MLEPYCPELSYSISGIRTEKYGFQLNPGCSVAKYAYRVSLDVSHYRYLSSLTDSWKGVIRGCLADIS